MTDTMLLEAPPEVAELKPRLVVMTVTRNEAGRYLLPMLEWTDDFLKPGGMLVYDDASSDTTAQIARAFFTVQAAASGYVVDRPPQRPSFMEHEGAFRNDALMQLQKKFDLHDGDWVLVLDADECITSNSKRAMANIITNQLKEFQRYDAFRIPIHSVWCHDESKRPMYRTDGAWNTLHEPRLWKYREGCFFDNLPMACRNEPAYVAKSGAIKDLDGVVILHYGYATPEERQVRYERYAGIDHGHLPSFIESINDADVSLETWRGSHWGE